MFVLFSNNTTDATSEAGTAYHSEIFEFTLGFSGVRVARSLVFFVYFFCRPLFVPLSVFVCHCVICPWTYSQYLHLWFRQKLSHNNNNNNMVIYRLIAYPNSISNISNVVLWKTCAYTTLYYASDTYLWIQSNCQQHNKKQYCPYVLSRKLKQYLWVHNKSQGWTL